MHDAGELLAIAERLARAAADVIRDRPSDLRAQSKTTPTDTVTIVDKAAERVIIDGLTQLRPGDRVVAEESGDSKAGSEVTWYVDPLDGTVNYLYGLPPYSVSIAAVVAGQPVAGVVLDVPRDELFTAVAGGGAVCNGRPISCGVQTEPALSLVATGFAYDAQVRTWQAEVVRGVLPQVRDIRRAGSAAVDLCNVACGRVDAFFEAGMYAWDWMAGSLIAREAGARVEGIGGRAPGRHVTIAANAELFAALELVLAGAGAGDRTFTS
jgi:myo-inositol-1(or 4)-monophosphatase